jgi:hypothetical protein
MVEGSSPFPFNWGINKPRKRAFLDLLKETTG